VYGGGFFTEEAESTNSSQISGANLTKGSGFNRSNTRKTESSKNRTKKGNEKNPFLDSMSESSMKEMEMQMTLQKNPLIFKLT